MAKKKSKKRYARKIPLAVTVGFAGTVLGGKVQGQTTLDHLKTGDYQGALRRLSTNLTGWNEIEGFNFRKMNWEPLIVGSIASMIASKSGLNRRLNIPYFKI